MVVVFLTLQCKVTVAAPVAMHPLLIPFPELPVCLMGWPSYYP